MLIWNMTKTGLHSFAWIADANVVQYAVATSTVPVCDWQLVGQQFGVLSYAMAFGPSLSATIVTQVNNYINMHTTDLVLNSLRNRWFRDWPSCLTDSGSSAQFNFKQFVLLFMIVWAFGCLGVLYRGTQDLFTQYYDRVQQTQEHTTLSRIILNPFLIWFYIAISYVKDAKYRKGWKENKHMWLRHSGSSYCGTRPQSQGFHQSLVFFSGSESSAQAAR